MFGNTITDKWEEGAMVPVGLTGIAYKFSISTKNPFPCGIPHLHCKSVTKMSVTSVFVLLEFLHQLVIIRPFVVPHKACQKNSASSLSSAR
jgi:hypothetical protein